MDLFINKQENGKVVLPSPIFFTPSIERDSQFVLKYLASASFAMQSLLLKKHATEIQKDHFLDIKKKGRNKRRLCAWPFHFKTKENVDEIFEQCN